MVSKNEEWDWEAFSEVALTAYSCARCDEAAHYWQRAHELSEAFAPNDPRRAASLNNRAIAHFRAGDFATAEARFIEALDAWEAGLDWIGSMELSPVARSSLFHLRMEQRHADSFASIRRTRFRELLAGAPALTSFNLALAKLFLDKDEDADKLLNDALVSREKSCGPNNPELVQICRTISGRAEMMGDATRSLELENKAKAISEHPARDALANWRTEQPQDLNDTRRLLAAAHLTVMLNERDFL